MDMETTQPSEVVIDSSREQVRNNAHELIFAYSVQFTDFIRKSNDPQDFVDHAVAAIDAGLSAAIASASALAGTGASFEIIEDYIRTTLDDFLDQLESFMYGNGERRQ